MIPRVHDPRVLGHFGGAAAGPSLLVLGGIHGNEPSGIAASQRVIEWLERRRPQLRGEVWFLVGNLSALHAGRRFIDHDLNRQWTAARMADLRSGAASGRPCAEHAEQLDLLARLSEAVGSARGELYFLDLHTSSAEGPPFLTIGDTLRNRRFARSFPLPLILGLEEQVDGALLEWLNNHGCITLGVEAGQHGAQGSVDRLEAVLWIALVASGILRAEDGPDLAAHRAALYRASAGVPPVIEVRQRHAITPADAFRMEPGYVNFQRISRGETLGRDARGAVRAAESGLLLLPLYQGQGEDGFFVARRVRPFWLRVSALLRRLRLCVLARRLPGVRHDAANPEVLIVDTRVARFYPLEIFHLLGFRRVRQVGPDLVVSRRRHDLEPPRSVSFC